MNKIVLEGKEYPVTLTMGACLEYKDLSGQEFDKVSGFSDIAQALYCCTKTACRRRGVEFDYALEDFSDALGVADAIEIFTNLMQSEMAGFDETSAKKKK